MGRTKIKPIQQPDDTTCGPVSLKHAIKILGKRVSLKRLIEMCKTTSNGTSTTNMIHTANKLGLSVLIVEYATLHHLKSALKYRSKELRAVLVSYLYDLDDDDAHTPHPESGHWAVVSSFRSANGRIVVLDSNTGSRKSYAWSDFRQRWWDYDLRRKKLKKRGRRFQLIKKWQPQLMLVIANDPESLPYFRTPYARVYVP